MLAKPLRKSKKIEHVPPHFLPSPFPYLPLPFLSLLPSHFLPSPLLCPLHLGELTIELTNPLNPSTSSCWDITSACTCGKFKLSATIKYVPIFVPPEKTLLLFDFYTIIIKETLSLLYWNILCTVRYSSQAKHWNLTIMELLRIPHRNSISYIITPLARG